MVLNEFWAGYISGAASILIGNPLDVVKVRMQAAVNGRAIQNCIHKNASSKEALRVQTRSLLAGLPGPILAYGALNAILFASYHQCLSLVGSDSRPTLSAHFFAGTVAGLATFVVSAPSELIKCRAQLASTAAASTTATSSWCITKDVLRTQGLRGLYEGGAVTSIRDGVGYGFYFLAYEYTCNAWTRLLPDASGCTSEQSRTLVCGGLAGVATWTSVFPLDVIKTRVQTQASFGSLSQKSKNSAWTVAKQMLTTEPRAFWRGLGVCNFRAFVVNAVQWSVYEWAVR